MRSNPPSSVPLARPVADALAGSTAIASLTARVRESNARYAAVREVLPAPLRAQVTAGPVDEESWALLAANAAAAAKLRQLLPRVEEALRQQGWPSRAIRIKICTNA